MTLAWDPAAGTLLATWPDVPRRDSFTLELTQAGSDHPAVTAGYTQLSYPLTGKLDDPSGWQLDLRALAAGSLGPAQPSLPMTAPSLTSVRYDSVAKVLGVTWSAVSESVLPAAGNAGLRAAAALRGHAGRHCRVRRDHQRPVPA